MAAPAVLEHFGGRPVTPAVIEAKGLTKRYSNGVLALDGLDLTVRGGEVYCLLGANGAGKTTAIGLFFDFHRPTSGNALICGVVVGEKPLEAKRHAAYVAENVLLYGSLTALQNLDFFARIGGCRVDRERLEETLALVGLEPEAFRRKVKTFSKGMRQKLGIAVAMVKESKAIFLDEPTTGLDPKAADEFMRILLDMRDAGRSILISTHDIPCAEAVADTVGIMKEGRLLRERRTGGDGRISHLRQEYLEAIEGSPHGASPKFRRHRTAGFAVVADASRAGPTAPATTSQPSLGPAPTGPQMKDRRTGGP